ncbi:MAG: hypothetical protein IJG84_11905 [Kiritimatiellae bacterium]|nr:hypothetical protein [Kiritimatiellia bacterium]
MAYQRPMVTVDQNMTTTPTSIEREQPAFIFGPNYELHRYSDESEKPKTKLGLYDGAQMTEKYPSVLDDRKVDKGYTKLFGDNVVVKLFDLTSATLPEVNVQPSKLATNGGYTMLLFSAAYLDYDFNGDPVQRATGLKKNLAVGDYLVVSYKIGAETAVNKFITRIADVKYSASQWNLDEDSSYEGAAGTLVTIEDAIPVEGNTVTANLVDVLSGVEFTRKNLAEANPSVSKWQWEQDSYTVDGDTFNGVRVNKLFALDQSYFGNTTDYGEVLFADLYLTYRELLTDYADTFHNITGASEVARSLGTVDPDNPLAMGVYMAALNAATDDGDEAPPVYFMAVPSDDVDGYSEVLEVATLNDRAYVFAPTTQDEAVLELVRNHVLEMSTKTVKQWRIAAASAKVPETEAKLSPASNMQGHPYFAIPLKKSGGAETGGSDYNQLRIVKSTSNVTGNTDIDLRSTNKLVAGDTIYFNPHTNKWGETDWDEYVVTAVINKYTVEVEGTIDVTGLEADTNNYVPAKIEAFHAYTDYESAEKVASVSKSMASRRMLNVFPPVFRSAIPGNQDSYDANTVHSDGLTMITGEFAACAVAGLISATEPQQPITNVTVRGIDDIPLTYQKYNKTELDLIASGGTFIIAQDLPGDLVYVRHQITTAYPDGNLNTAELSITKNVDSISYAFADTFRPYYGKYNITPELVAILENLAGQLISQFGGSNSVYGPQLITDQTSIKYVRQNVLMKDHVDVAISLGVPYPCNNIDIVLTV